MMFGDAWRRETTLLDDTARLTANGSFIRLAHGYTHYQAAGPERARPVVLVHGFSVPYFIWEPTFRALVDAGMRAVRYDLYGRGYSDRPRVAYDLSLFLTQLGQLLDALGHTQVDLVGLSMGGPIAAAFSVDFPHRVRKLVLIDPSGVSPIHLGILYRLAVLPGISDVIFAIAGSEYMLNNVAADFFDHTLVQVFRERYRVQMQYRGFKRAILSTVRHNMLGSFRNTYAQLGDLGMPVLLIWGENDKTISFKQSQILRGLLPQAQFLAVTDCGHIPHFERPEVVQPRLIDFLS